MGTGVGSSDALCSCFHQGVRNGPVYFEEIRVFKAGDCLNTAAWNNGIGLASYFVGLEM
jgi:hypothetical protein